MIRKIMVLALVIAGLAVAGVGDEALASKYQTLYHSENIQAVPVEMPRYSTHSVEGEEAGVSTYDHQNHITLHRFAMDADGYAHMFWMKSLMEVISHDDRNTSYNVYGDGDFVWEGGIQSDGATRSGYGGGDVLSTGQGVSWFHEDDAATAGVLWTAITVDAEPRFGAFATPVRPGGQGDPGPEIYWPQGYVDRVNDNVLITGRSPDDNEEPYTRIFYSRSTDAGASFDPFNVLEGDNTASGPHIVGSHDGSKIAMIYTKGYPCQADYTTSYACDIYYKESTDGGATWGPEYNVTEDHTLDNPPAGTDGDPFATPLSTNFAGCYDEDGNLHVVWADIRTWLNESDPLSIYINHPFHSRIMHWSEASPNEFTRASGQKSMYIPLNEGGDTNFVVWEEGWWGFDQEIQQNNVFYNCKRPVVIFDEGVGLCFWRGQRYYDDISQANTINWDIFVSISDDGGATWNPIEEYPDSLADTWLADITNLTDTYTPGAGINECASEDYIDIDERSGITVNGDEYSCPLFYQKDLFSGSAIHESATQGYYTQNPQMYLSPDAWSAKVIKEPDTDTNVVVEEDIVGFELVSPTVVGNVATWRITSPVAEASLKVYDATGSLVADISADNAVTMTWDTRETASGVYYYVFKSSYYSDRGSVVVVH